MKRFHQYWTFSAIRGAMTMLASVAIVAIPQAASSMLSIPVMIGLAVNCLATYSIFDGGVMVLLAKLLPTRVGNQRVLYAQASMAVVFGVMFYLVVCGRIDLHWLMWIAASQAAVAAVVEFAVARGTHRQYGCFSCYTTSLTLGASALALPFAHGLSATGMSFALASYVGAYGASELLLGAKMLFVEYRIEHPATIASGEWRLEMDSPAPVSPVSLTAHEGCVTCKECPADAFCHDDSLTGQVARVLAERRPAIVLSTRVVELLEQAKDPVAA